MPIHIQPLNFEASESFARPRNAQDSLCHFRELICLRAEEFDGNRQFQAKAETQIKTLLRPKKTQKRQTRNQSLKNSPFDNWNLTVAAVATIIGGKIVYRK